MVDHLMDALLTKEAITEAWNTPDGQPLYPPQHVGYLVNMFMWPDADPKAVSRVFMYFLFDLNYLYLQSNNVSPNRYSINSELLYPIYRNEKWSI